MDRANPYADYGTVVSGERFIGRERELSLIRGRIFGDRAFGSLAVVGLPRIGKTSLVQEAIQREDARFDPLRVVVARVDVGTFASVNELFVSLISNLHEEVKLKNLSTSLIEERAVHVLDGPSTGFDGIRRFFRSLRQHNVRAVCVLDEFDAGRYVFADNPQCFHWLRELCSNPEFKAAVVLLSKRRLQDIARIAGHESDYWANVLMTVSVRGFDEVERSGFFDRLATNGVVLDDVGRAEVEATCGGHPYLLDAFAYFAFERVAMGERINVGQVRRMTSHILRSYFEQVETVLHDGPVLRKVVQILVGPQYDVVADDVDSLVAYGVLQRDEQRAVKPFADAFCDYLRLVESRVDIWPLWRDTERALRDALDSRLEERFGSPWLEPLKKAHQKLCTLIESCEGKIEHERARFGIQASENVLAYSYPHEIFQIMSVDWSSLGEPLLGKDRQAWASKFALLSKIRTPLAHNREEAIQVAERTQTEGICKEILARLEQWRTGRALPSARRQ